MELRQNMRHAATRPRAFVVAVLFALMLALIGWYMRPIGAVNHSTGVHAPIVTSVESPRSGGPGGQIGDAAQPDQTARAA